MGFTDLLPDNSQVIRYGFFIRLNRSGESISFLGGWGIDLLLLTITEPFLILLNTISREKVVLPNTKNWIPENKYHNKLDLYEIKYRY